MKAQAQLALSESEQALATIDQALQLTDEVPLYWLIKVKVLIALERWADALAVTLETAEKFPEEERAYLYEMRQMHIALHIEGVCLHHLSESTLSALLVALMVSDQTLVEVSSLLLGKLLRRL